MTKLEEFGTIEPLAAVVKKPEVYFGTKVVRSWMLAERLVGDALALGVSSVVVIRQSQNWTSVGSVSDWTAIGPGSELGVVKLFRCMIPFDAAGINEIRHEILVTAFASDVFLVRDSKVITIKGESNSKLADEISKSWPFSINFRGP